MFAKSYARFRNAFAGARRFVAAIAKGNFRLGTVKAALGGTVPGSWQSDHREECNHFTGWSYVAIHALCLQVMRAKVEVVRALDVQKGKPADFAKSDYRAKHAEEEILPADHPACRLLAKPSPKQTGAMLRYRRALQLKLTGTALVWEVPTKLGMIVERYVVPTALAEPLRPQPQYPNGAYRLTPQVIPSGWDDGWADTTGYQMAMGMVIDAADVSSIRMPHPLFAGDGYSPLAAGAKWIDTAEMADASRWGQLKNGANPSLYFEAGEGTDTSPEELDIAAVKIQKAFGGPQNSGRVVIGPPGSKPTKITMTAQEMDYENAYIQLRDAILALHATPPVAIGVLDGGSYAAFYAALKQYITLAVQPVLDLMSEEDTERIAKQYGKDLFVRYTAITIDDPELLEKQLATDISAGAITIDEFRAIRGMPPLPGGKGQELVHAAKAPGEGEPKDGQTETGAPKKPTIGDLAAGKTEPAGDTLDELNGKTLQLNTREAILRRAHIESHFEEIVKTLHAANLLEIEEPLASNGHYRSNGHDQ